MRHTLVEFKIRDCLPLVCCDEPLVVFSAAGQVDDELGLVVSERVEYALEALFAELGRGE